MKTISFTKVENKAQKGFTLIELLIVIGILAILMAIVLIAINPARQFAQANNSKRTNDATQLLNSVGQYMSDNKGSLPPGIATAALGGTPVDITSTMSNGGNTGADFCNALTPKYMAALPTDPSGGTGGSNVSNCSSYDTGYTISVSTGSASRVTITAPNAQAIDGVVPNISVTR